ncbi:peptidylprolyl isomerase [bacterium]|nr:peptidylprolyl isomerase [bacterium]
MMIIFTGCKESGEMIKKGDSQKMAENKQSEEAISRPQVLLKTDYGDIVIELRPDKAPKTTENFLKLTNEGFYDDLTFHRIIKGFMIQGGDPKGDGTGGPGYTVPAEITDLKHVRGALATARLGDQANPQKASSGSQFFICHQAATHLDGQYTVFGSVVKGIDVVDKIANVPMADPRMGRPQKPVNILKVEVISK